jgi:DNA-binding transcriptional LysR family regulator
LETANDFQGVTLLHDAQSWPDASEHSEWQAWLRVLKDDSIDPRRGLHFNLADLAIAAALAGNGVAIAGMALVMDDLEKGRLVPLSRKSVRSPARYVLLAMDKADRRVNAFSDWLREECESFESSRRRMLDNLAVA